MSTTFHEYLKAGYPLIWVRTHEETRAFAMLSENVQEEYGIYSWDIVTGIKGNGTEPQIVKEPAKVLQTIKSLPDGTVVFLKDFHKFLGNVEILRTLKNLIPDLKAGDKHIAFISPVFNPMPVELEKEIVIYDFALPTVGELVESAKRIVVVNQLDDIPIDEQAIQASKGLTLHEAENALALSLVREKKFSRAIIEEEKLQAVKKSGLMEVYEAVPESDLGGLDELKKYIHSRKRSFLDLSLPQLRGILLVGLPGAGKSLSAKVIASVLDFVLLRFDIGSLKGSLVGESEAKLRQALALIDAISPCVVWIDEIEKVLSGVQSSGKSDGGTTATMFGTFLTWMQESRKPHYIIATCNDIGDLLAISQGALLRRFDDIFFVDIPSARERDDILKIMNRRYNTEVDVSIAKKMEGWTGADIEKFVIASVYDGIDDAFVNIKPIFYQNRQIIESAREWAKSNARIANVKVEVVEQKRKVRVS